MDTTTTTTVTTITTETTMIVDTVTRASIVAPVVGGVLGGVALASMIPVILYALRKLSIGKIGPNSGTPKPETPKPETPKPETPRDNNVRMEDVETIPDANSNAPVLDASSSGKTTSQMQRGTDRVIVHATDQQLQLLLDSEMIFVDGTFSTASNGFDPVFLMHAQLFGQGMRVAFNIDMRFKQEATLFGKQFQPTHVASDFESAIMSAVRRVFPAAKHSNCLFHFTQCIHRKIMSLGLGADYAQVATIHQQCKELMGLSLMPICEVEQQFKRIREISSSSLDDLFEYF
ncbi:unnamed protein product [Rotaria socialis]